MLKTLFSKISRLLPAPIWKETHKVLDDSTLKHISDDFFTGIGQTSIHTIFDIGAHIGLSTKKFLNDFPQATIFSAEPSKRNFDSLLITIQQNQRVSAHPIAFGDTDSKADLYHSERSQCNSLNTPWKYTGTSETVNIRKIDTFCREKGIDRINILKIDTEGHELSVLKGAEKMLKKGKIDIIYVECGFKPEDRCHSNFFAIAEYLRCCNYNVAGFTETSNFLWSELYTLLFCNAIFVRGQTRIVKKSV